MQYIVLIYLSEHWEKLSNDEKNKVHEDCGAWHEELVKSGHTRGATGLQPAATARTVRVKNGKPTITDGPFAETKEVLGGFEIIECADIEKATTIANRFPGLQVGAVVEVRPIVTSGSCREE